VAPSLERCVEQAAREDVPAHSAKGPISPSGLLTGRGPRPYNMIRYRRRGSTVEQFFRKEQVVGSIPTVGSNTVVEPMGSALFCAIKKSHAGYSLTT
jgi:hypothetical protein